MVYVRDGFLAIEVAMQGSEVIASMPPLIYFIVPRIASAGNVNTDVIVLVNILVKAVIATASMVLLVVDP